MESNDVQKLLDRHNRWLEQQANRADDDRRAGRRAARVTPDFGFLRLARLTVAYLFLIITVVAGGLFLIESMERERTSQHPVHAFTEGMGDSSASWARVILEVE